MAALSKKKFSSQGCFGLCGPACRELLNTTESEQEVMHPNSQWDRPQNHQPFHKSLKDKKDWKIPEFAYFVHLKLLLKSLSPKSHSIAALLSILLLTHESV